MKVLDASEPAEHPAAEAPTVPDWQKRVVALLVRNAFLRNRRGGPWPPPPELAVTPVQFTGNTGARVEGRWFTPSAGSPDGAVVLVHPHRRYGQHWFVREGIVHFLLDHGYAALTFDLPGYGESKGGGVAFHEDVERAVAVARQRARGAPVHAWGASMGAFAIVNAAPRLEGVDSLILESPFPTYNAWYGRGPGWWAMALFDRVFPRASRTIQGHLNAPHARAGRVLVAASAEDTITPAALSRAVARRLPGERTRYVEVRGPDHLRLFRESAEYRAAVLETLRGDAA